jgi:hypothetical protein
VILYLLFRNKFERFSDRDNHAILIILILLFYPLITYDYLSLQERGWNPGSETEEGRWMIQNGTLTFIDTVQRDRAKLFLKLESYSEPRRTNLFLNDELVDTFEVPGNQILEYTFLIKPLFGLNIITLENDPGCALPQFVEGTTDTRCISLHLWDWSITEFDDNLTYSKGWYPKSPDEDGRWTNENTSLIIFSDNQDFSIEVFGWSMLEDTNLTVFKEGEPLATWEFYYNPAPAVENANHHILEIESNSEFTELDFISSSNCTVPAEFDEQLDDMRCLGVQFTEVLIDPVSVPEGD